MSMKTVEIKRDGVYIDGEKFFLLSGDFHYFRTLPEGWKKRLRYMKDFGLTAVTTYVPWNLHEPQRGEFCFEGVCDLERFLREADEVGLKVILRCSPYLCGEWEFGGLPWWLLEDRRICLRSGDPLFVEPLKEYYDILLEKVRPYLHTNGGPVILVGVENEYGSFGSDKEYLRLLADLFEKKEIDVPSVSANGSDPFKYWNGTLEENWNGIDLGARPESFREFERLSRYQPDKPLMVGEAWVGSIMFWGKMFVNNRNIQAECDFFRKALENNVVINFYMFCGGTNFGFMSGALLRSKGYEPLMTSYDYDAPIGEDGEPREKYFALRDVLDEYLGLPKRPHTAPIEEKQKIESISLTECAPLLENLDELCEKHLYTHRTWCMEDLGQDHGFVLYKTFLPYTDDRERYVDIDGLADRATLYLDGVYLGSMMRDKEGSEISFRIREGGSELAILVENMGRVNYGYGMYDTKGINGCIHFRIMNPDGTKLYNYAACMGFDTYTLPFKSTVGAKYRPVESVVQDGTPMLFRGRFRAEPGKDTFVDTKDLGKGLVFVNGFNLGRYWSIGPQRTLYLPGELLREENTIEILALYGLPEQHDRTVSCIEIPLLSEETEEKDMTLFELK